MRNMLLTVSIISLLMALTFLFLVKSKISKCIYIMIVGIFYMATIPFTLMPITMSADSGEIPNDIAIVVYPYLFYILFSFMSVLYCIFK